MTLGGMIRELRQKRGLTQEELGEKLFTRKTTISAYENDVIDIKCSVLKDIAEALHVFPGYFFMGDDHDSRINEAMTILTSIKDERLLQAAIDHIRITGSLRMD